MNRDFNKWLDNFKSSISNYSYYVDFEKIYKSAEKYKVELNILNSLIGSNDIEKEFENIILKYPETLEVIPMLLAVRSNEIFVKHLTAKSTAAAATICIRNFCQARSPRL